MEVHFHSDASNNDWGVRLSAYGILQVRANMFSLLSDTDRGVNLRVVVIDAACSPRRSVLELFVLAKIR